MIDGRKIHANFPRFERGNSSAKRTENGLRRKEYSANREEPFQGGAGVFGNRRGHKTFAGVVRNISRNPLLVLKPVVFYHSSEKDKARFLKAYVGKVIILWSSYNIHTSFELEGLLTIKVTPLGANLCLLKEIDEGFI